MRVQNFTPIQHQLPLPLPQLLAPTILLSIIFLPFLLSISVNLSTKNAMGFPSSSSSAAAAAAAAAVSHFSRVRLCATP